jgi:hypothetical protein
MSLTKATYSMISGASVNVLDYGADPTGVAASNVQIQNAINAAVDAGKSLYVPSGFYKITETLTIPFRASQTAGLLMFGEGRMNSMFFNMASSNKPTLVFEGSVSVPNKMTFQCENMGFMGFSAYPNDAIHLDTTTFNATFENCFVMANGRGINITNALGIELINCEFGASDMFTYMAALGFPATTFVSSAHIFFDIADANSFVTSTNIIQCKIGNFCDYNILSNNQGTSAIGLNIKVQNCTLSNSNYGSYLLGFQNVVWDGNYFGEGECILGGYALWLNNSIYCTVSNNYLYDAGRPYNTGNCAILLQNCNNVVFEASFIPCLLLAGTTNNIVMVGVEFYTIYDYTDTYNISLVNCSDGISIGQYLAPINMHKGRNELKATTNNAIKYYPSALIGSSYFYYPACQLSYVTTAGSTGTLTHTSGTNPDPILQSQYLSENKYDFKIIITTGGGLSAAKYKIQRSAQGAGTYTDFETNIAMTGYFYCVGIQGSEQFFQLQWSSATYTVGDTWTVTSVTAPTLTPA